MKFLQLLRLKNKAVGFSLIELSIVIALLLILATLVGAHVSFLNRLVLRSELELLCNTCFYMQRRALMLNRQQTIYLYPEKNCYAIEGRTFTLPSHVVFGFLPGAKGPPSAPEHLIEQPITFKNNCITFYPDGTISAGALYLADSAKQWGYALSCPVSAVSYLRKYQYNGTWQHMS